MGWWLLLIAGIFEIGFVVSMKLQVTDGNRNWFWTVAFYVCIISSFSFLEEAVKTIPIGTAYAVWTGIGVFGVGAIGMIYLGDPATPTRVIFLTLLIASLIGLKLTSVS